MKRHKIIQHIERHGCIQVEENRAWVMYRNPSNDKKTTIPRHADISPKLADSLCKDLDIPPIK